MKAARLHETDQSVKVVDQELPDLEPNEVLVRLEACGVCHSDLHIREGDDAFAPTQLPITLGHEGIGIVEALGANVQSISVGDRIGAPWLYDACLDCPDCASGYENLCANQRARGNSG